MEDIAHHPWPGCTRRAGERRAGENIEIRQAQRRRQWADRTLLLLLLLLLVEGGGFVGLLGVRLCWDVKLGRVPGEHRLHRLYGLDLVHLVAQLGV